MLFFVFQPSHKVFSAVIKLASFQSLASTSLLLLGMLARLIDISSLAAGSEPDTH